MPKPPLRLAISMNSESYVGDLGVFKSLRLPDNYSNGRTEGGGEPTAHFRDTHASGVECLEEDLQECVTYL